MRTQLQDPAIYDCLRTCIANIFDLDRLEVPNFGYSAIEEGHDPGSVEYALAQNNEVDEWCLGRGIAPFTMLINEDGLPRPMLPWGLCVAMGPGPRRLRHGVVWDAGFWKTQNAEDGKMIHDPYPSGDGLLKVESWLCFGLLGRDLL